MKQSDLRLTKHLFYILCKFIAAPKILEYDGAKFPESLIFFQYSPARIEHSYSSPLKLPTHRLEAPCLVQMDYLDLRENRVIRHRTGY